MVSTVLCTGVWDILHYGHLVILLNAKELGERLVVAVKEEEAVIKQKGFAPVLTLSERIKQIRVLPFVDQVISYSSNRQAIKMISPNLLVHGSDWYEQGDRTELLKVMKEHKTGLCLLSYTSEISDTEIRKRIIHRHKEGETWGFPSQAKLD